MTNASVDRVAPYVERFFENGYARKSMDDAVSALREAYQRGARKGARAPADRKFRDQLTEAVVAMRETVDAFQTGRRRPKGRFKKRALVIAAAGVLVVGAALASNDEFRNSLLGKPTEGGGEGDG
jgi:hypothetical protein